MFDFRRITLFCLEKRLSKHKMTIFSKNLGGHSLFGSPGYPYEYNGKWRRDLRLFVNLLNKFTFSL